MDICTEHVNLLAHIKTVEQTRELVGAISAFTREESACEALQALHSKFAGSTLRTQQWLCDLGATTNLVQGI